MKLRCYLCGYETEDRTHFKCPKCGGFFELPLRTDLELSSLKGERMQRYFSWLEFSASSAYRSLGEGDTPLIYLEKEKVYLKLESSNPTGSFKDRGASILVAELTTFLPPASHLYVDSSGNAGAALAAFSARYEFKAHIYAPLSASREKEAQIRAYGATFHRIKGGRDEIVAALFEDLKQKKGYYASHQHSPYYLQGTKTAAYELAESFDWNPPEFILAPAGAGSLTLGMTKGFKELELSGITSTHPQVVAVQSVNNPPIVKALNGFLPEEVPYQVGLADAIMTRFPIRLQQMKDFHKENRLQAWAVTEKEIKQAWIDLAKYGIYAEPTSATTLAAVRSMREQGEIQQGETVVITITGHGLKKSTTWSQVLQQDST